MKYKDRRQYGPDQPVEFLEFRPTLVPSILVNRLWADEGTSILWKRYPHLPALQNMRPARRQYYASKIERIFSLGPPPDRTEPLDYLDNLAWPNLKSLELEVDLQRHGAKFSSMMHPRLEHLEISGIQSGGSTFFVEVVFPSMLAPCQSLKSIRFTPESVSDDDPLHTSALYQYIGTIPSITSVEVKATNFVDKDYLFIHLSHRLGLEGLEIDLEPGLSLLPQLSEPTALPKLFSSLKRLTIMCYPEIALALPNHLRLIEELQIDVCRIPDQRAREPDFTIIDNLFAELIHCPRLRLLKIGIGAMALDFPSFRSLPIVSGASLVNVSAYCPELEDINIFSTDPSAIDGSNISSEQFDTFCENLPRLRNLSLKLHPATASLLVETALQSLGEHCRELELLRLKLPFQLPSLPVPSTIPEILINDEPTFNIPVSEDTSEDTLVSDDQENLSIPDSSLNIGIEHSPVPWIPPLFPHLIHLAISRPGTVLSTVNDAFTMSSTSLDGAPSDIVEEELEEELVRLWAHPLLTHFPRLEILEAWGDWMGQDNESLNYFLPTEEILASTWEFLSGTEQDLWDDEEDLQENDNWQAYESETDWDVASYVDEFISIDEKLRPFEEEPDGMITPGRTHDKDAFFESPGVHSDSEPLNGISSVNGRGSGNALPHIPTDELADMRVS